MTKKNIESLRLLQEIVGRHLLIAPDEVTPTTNFEDELGADSLDLIEIVLKIEYEFDIDIEDQYANRIRTIQDVLDYFEHKII